MNHKIPISSMGGEARELDRTGAGTGGMLFEHTVCGGPGYKAEIGVVYYNAPNNAPMTNGDRVRGMSDAALAEWIVGVVDFALRQNGIIKSQVVCSTYKQLVFRHLKRPAMEDGND